MKTNKRISEVINVKFNGDKKFYSRNNNLFCTLLHRKQLVLGAKTLSGCNKLNFIETCKLVFNHRADIQNGFLQFWFSGQVGFDSFLFAGIAERVQLFAGDGGTGVGRQHPCQGNFDVFLSDTICTVGLRILCREAI